MSVRVPDRNLSRIEYIYNAQQIVNIVEERITKYINKIANDKRYKGFTKSAQYSIWNAPIYHAKQVYHFCQLANMKRNANIRLEYLNKASDNLELLESATQDFYDKFRPIIKDKFILLLAEKVEYQKKLLKGCKQYSKNINCQS